MAQIREVFTLEMKKKNPALRRKDKVTFNTAYIFIHFSIKLNGQSE